MYEKSFSKEPFGKFISKVAKNAGIHDRVINHSLRISSISRLLSMQDAATSENFVGSWHKYLLHVNANLVFSTRFMAPARFVLES